MQQQQASKALPHLKAAIAAEPRRNQYWMSYIDALMRAGETNTARQVCDFGAQQGLPAVVLQGLRARLAHTSAQAKADAATLDALRALAAAGQAAEVARHAPLLLLRFPWHPVLWKLCAAALHKTGDRADALEAGHMAAMLAPHDAETQHLLGSVLLEAQRGEEAALSFRRAIALQPGWADAHCKLGSALLLQGQYKDATNCFAHALALQPNLAEAHNGLGTCQCHLGLLAAAVGSFRQALAIQPDLAHVQVNLGNVLREQQQWGEAQACYRAALQQCPDMPEALNNLGSLCMAQGDTTEAARCFEQALQARPDWALAHHNRLFCLTHDENLSPAQVFAAHRAFGQRYDGLWPGSRHRNTPDPHRPLRVGFISGDLRKHPVAHFMEPVWAALNRHTLVLWAYANHPAEDEASARLRAHTQGWRMVAGWSDEALAAQIAADQMDVLIDLSGHTAHNRLLALARKPAPVQATWLGYPNTTGLRAIDYLICDRYNAPHGLYEHLYVEQFARLPSATTFAHPADAPAPNALPAQQRGYLTFGSFNRPSKLGEGVIATWCRVLHALPDARLLLAPVDDAAQAAQCVERFARHGIAAHRLSFHPRLPLRDYLALHHEVDMLLDTWPYTGGTTTYHALWMGVPVLTLRGPSRVQCQSAAALARLGLADWIADTPDDWVALALHKAGALDELASLRASLRPRWAQTPLCQPATVARGLEHALRHMWQRWCTGLPPVAFEVPPPA